ncbi:hypothetical protein [Paenibacillus riograndensis]|uniref:Secreted protein n=1 Tax=Paenibacillus riograndensis SBR5 TaxID=1073571 RepID=A0A0E4CW00_9BACL|nr:hypothetical protein [Paenibacillus riograndensis]CQR54726.1 hypothetical protein PRIO_2317 [Paenibacillus riograndensis SBR5]
MKKIWFTTATGILLSASILGACSNNETANEAEPTASSAAATPVVEASAAPEPSAAPTATEAQESASPDDTGPQATERPKTRTFGEQEGGGSGQTGTLEQGDGYSLYVFEDFTLDAQSGRLSLTKDPAYYADIEHLAAGYDLAALKQQGQTELSAMGKVSDHSGELFEHPLGFADLYLQAAGDKGIEDYMVWKNQAGEAFLFRIHNPKGELSNKFVPWVMVSLATLENSDLMVEEGL